MKENKLVDDNVVGSYDPRYPNAKYEPTELGVRDGVRGLNDRTVAIQWITNCKVWIANETWWEGNGAPRTHYRKNLKLYNMVCLFLVNGAYGTLEYIEDLGFKSYRDVFGDYIVENDSQKLMITLLKL